MEVQQVMFRALTSSVTGGPVGQSFLLHLFDDGAFPRLSGTYGEHSEVTTRLTDETVKANHTFLHTFKIVSSTFAIGY